MEKRVMQGRKLGHPRWEEDDGRGVSVGESAGVEMGVAEQKRLGTS